MTPEQIAQLLKMKAVSQKDAEDMQQKQYILDNHPELAMEIADRNAEPGPRTIEQDARFEKLKAALAQGKK
jgi:hypothetical protein